MNKKRKINKKTIHIKKNKKHKNHKHHHTTKKHHDQKQQSKENKNERNKNDTPNLETEKEIENQNEDETYNNEVENQNEDETDNNEQICPDGDDKKIKKQNNRTERYIISKLCEDKLKKIDSQEIFHKNGKLYTCKLCMYFDLNKNKADALDHYTTKHAHISGVFCPICYKNFQSIGATKKHNIRQKL